MSSGEPLLYSSAFQDPSKLPEHQPSLIQLNCLCPNSSFSSSSYEDCGAGSFRVSDGEELFSFNNDRHHHRDESDLSSRVTTGRFQSADSHFFDSFKIGCAQEDSNSNSKKPSHRANRSLMDKPAVQSTLEISIAQTKQERPNKSQRSRHKSGQIRSGQLKSGPLKSGPLEDPFSAEEEPRLIYINDPRRTNDKYEFTGNEIRTSKYTFITFLPKNLFTQFHRVAYLYFLVIAALNQLPPLAVFGRTASLFPLLFVLFVTAIKDGYEDWRRHRSDRKENNREALVLQSGEFRMKKWKHICVGEVVKIDSDETIPCDIVLLGTSDPNGIAYIQTMNLDGESNLKTRYARQETVSMVSENLYTGLIRCEQPNRNIYEFTAAMEFNNTRVPLGQANIVLRGCQLKNTDWLIGVVVYAGQETKAMMNSTPSPSKSSKLESYMNRETLWLSLFLFAICAVVAAGMGIWLINHADQLDTSPYYRKKYFGRDNGKDFKYYGLGMEIFFSFLSSVIIFQIMIPISLYITMELVRLGQSYFMIGDRHMYDASSDSRFQCRSLNINEDLGQIRYVFSDKTGTLTENKMEFRRASIFGKDYGDSLQVMTHSSHEITSSGPLITNSKPDITIDPDLARLLQRDLTTEERIAAHEFFLTLAACNTVIPVTTEDPPIASCQVNDVKSIVYQGESPDEQALVTAASAYGYTLVERTTGHIAIDIHGERIRLDVLGLHEFDSFRKRMSVVVRFPNNRVKVLVKGADNLMLSILNPASHDSSLQAKILASTQNHLTNYSSQGLRTLVIGSRDLTEIVFDKWQERYEEASTAIHDRTSKLRLAASLIECELSLLGATGIEDKLQEGVPEAIESLRQAGIKVWVLTGDKQETAISIGLSCRLLTGDMEQIVINGSSEAECRRLLTEANLRYGIKPGDGLIRSGSVKKGGFDSNLRRNGSVSENGPLALIIDGTSLVYILEKELENELFDLATSCKVVLCCRVAPLQKAGIVDLIKSRTSDMTLAIGDGANDVSMIQMADVGVGICGQEGRQAVMASDFAMGQFRFLKRLLLVHGHWNYQRVGYLVLYNFYRNAVFVLMLFWYILYTAYSATSALTDWSSVFYSLIYTSLPTIVVGVLDKDLSHKTLIHYPKLYQAGHRHESYNMRLFWITMLDTLWQSLVIFYVPYMIFHTSIIDIWSLGSLWTLAVVVLVNVHLAMDTRRWVFITHVAIWGSIVITFVSMVLIDSIPVFPNYGTIYNTGASVTYWITILLIIILALLPRFLGKVIYQMFWPSDIQIAREAEIMKKLPTN